MQTKEQLIHPSIFKMLINSVIIHPYVVSNRCDFLYFKIQHAKLVKISVYL